MVDVQAIDRVPTPQALEPQKTNIDPRNAATIHALHEAIVALQSKIVEATAQNTGSANIHKRDKEEKIDQYHNERRKNTYSQMGYDIIGGAFSVGLGFKDASCSNAMNTVVSASSVYHNTNASEIQQKIDKTNKGIDAASEAKRSASEMTKTTNQYLERMVDEHDRVIHKPVTD